MNYLLIVVAHVILTPTLNMKMITETGPLTLEGCYEAAHIAMVDPALNTGNKRLQSVMCMPEELNTKAEKTSTFFDFPNAILKTNYLTLYKG